ncbi:MAG: Na(+)-translocating NADH-quinone reductase subunit A [Prevotellaceae bacterium]|jgi:Na+-transporting NADH:ubiquinone oxidoreductase subunit A|nr:Na(+)-translocating NADH-quinone reductase subunit A [Prevotellaceae bacterium]
MLNVIPIRKGHTISLKGAAEKILSRLPPPASYALKPGDFPHLTPRLLVGEGDRVLAGAPLFVDKYRPAIRYASPVSGTVSAIVRGDRRRLLSVIVTPSYEQEYVQRPVADLSALAREEVVALLLESGAWPFIRQRPFGTVADPADYPKAIFISGFDTAPLAPDADFTLTGETLAFQKGIDVLHKLADRLYLGLHDEMGATSILQHIKGVEKKIFRGPHPSGNVGVQIHHISPLNKGEKVWTVDPQHIVSLGRLFLQGVYDVSKVIALTGSEVKRPRYFRMRSGASLSTIAGYVHTAGRRRYISGNVLTGTNVGPDGHLGFYDNAITVIPEGDQYEFLGWANPLRLHRYSVSRSYLSWMFPHRKYALDANINGGERAFVLTGLYEKVLPMDILPVYLLKAILAGDVDKMEQLGIYEVIEEDLALCEFVCPSKIPVQAILRKGIALMLNEEQEAIPLTTR